MGKRTNKRGTLGNELYKQRLKEYFSKEAGDYPEAAAAEFEAGIIRKIIINDHFQQIIEEKDKNKIK